MEEKKEKNFQYCCDGEISPGDGWTGRREKQEENPSQTIEPSPNLQPNSPLLIILSKSCKRFAQAAVMTSLCEKI